MRIRSCYPASLITIPFLLPILVSAVLADDVKTTILRGEAVDADTRAPLPCRISIRGDNGAWHFPSSVALDGSAVIYNKHSLSDPFIVEMHTTLSAHPFQVSLPPGRYTVVVERGKEYHPAIRQVKIASKPLRITIPLRRWIDIPRLDWYSGETHTHRPVSALPNLRLAEDLNVVFPLVDWVREAFMAPVVRRSPSSRDPGPDPIKIDATHWIYPRNTVYVHLGKNSGFDGSAWLDGLNQGRSFVTTGQMLLVSLDGHDPGAVLRRGPNRLQGRAVGALPLKRNEIVVNGEVARTLIPRNEKSDRDAYESPIDEHLMIDGSSWVAVRCFEDRRDGRIRFAHTGPFHIEVPDRPLRPRKVGSIT